MIPHFMRYALPAATLVFLPTTASAQIGPLIDWINKMSGPQFWGAGVAVSWGYRPGQFLQISEVDAVADLVGPGFEPGTRGGQCVASIRTRLASVDATFAYDEDLVDRIHEQLPAYRTQAGRGAAAVQERSICELSNAVDRLDMFSRDPMSGVIFRFEGFAGVDRTSGDDPYDVYVVRFQSTVGYLSALNIELEAGVAVEHFMGDIDAFWHVSYPILLSWHPVPRHRSRFARAFRVGTGVRIYPEFDDGVFGPAFDLEDGLEFVPTVFFGFDFRIR